MFSFSSYLTGLLSTGLVGLLLWRSFRKRLVLDFRFSRDIFRETITVQNVLRFRARILRTIPEIIDFRVFVLHDEGEVQTYPPSRQVFTPEMKTELHQLVGKSLHRIVQLGSSYTLNFLSAYKHNTIIAKAYDMPNINRKILTLVIFPASASRFIDRGLLHSSADMLAFLVFMAESTVSSQKAMSLLQESFWDSPYPIGVCSPKGELVMGNDALHELFQGNIPNFSELADPKVFMLLLDGKRIGKTFTLRGRKVRLEAYPMANRNFLITRCVFIFYDEQVEFKREALGDTNTLRRFAAGNPSIGTAMFKQDGTLLYSNEAFMNTLHILKAREAVQKSVFDLFQINPSQFQEIVSLIRDGKEHEKNLTAIETDYEFTVRFRSVVFGAQNTVEVILEQENVFSENSSFLDKETKEIHEELHTARSVQEHILALPPIYRPGIEVDTLYAPSRQLSGDFFSVVPFSDTHIGFLIADVSGHGVSASLITAALKILIQLAPKEPERLPAIISYFNTYLANILPEGSFVTLFYGILSLKDYSFRYINCGHPFPILEDLDLHETHVLEGVSYPLGGLLNVSYDDQVRTIEMPARGRLLFYTDGLLQHLTGDTKEKLDKIRGIISTNKNKSRHNLVQLIYHRLVARNTPIPEDDVSLMLISFDRMRTRRHTLTISSSLMEADAAISSIGEYLQKEAKLIPGVYWRIHTAFYEALLNAIVHGNRYNTQKKVTITYRIFNSLIAIRVRDEGEGFNPSTLPDPIDEDNILTQFGRGVKMIRTLCDRVKFNRKGNEILICFKLNKQEDEGNPK